MIAFAPAGDVRLLRGGPPPGPPSWPGRGDWGDGDGEPPEPPERPGGRLWPVWAVLVAALLFAGVMAVVAPQSGHPCAWQATKVVRPHLACVRR